MADKLKTATRSATSCAKRRRGRNRDTLSIEKPHSTSVLLLIERGRKRSLRVTSKKVLARKWRPTFFLLSGAKKVGRRKSSQIKGLCLETPAPGTDKWRF